jgi:hypothetical protein
MIHSELNAISDDLKGRSGTQEELVQRYWDLCNQRNGISHKIP